MTRSFGRLEAFDLLNNFRIIDLANRNRRAGDDTSIRSCGQHFPVRCQIKRKGNVHSKISHDERKKKLEKQAELQIEEQKQIPVDQAGET
ncbi:hypothetical protein ACLKA6_000156 [Drosophila palustris]